MQYSHCEDEVIIVSPGYYLRPFFAQFASNLRSVDITGFVGYEAENGPVDGLKIPDAFLINAVNLTRIKLPRVTEVGDCFLLGCSSLKFFSALDLKVVGDDFMNSCYSLLDLFLPQLEKIGTNFAISCKSLRMIRTKKMSGKEYCSGFVKDCKSLISVDAMPVSHGHMIGCDSLAVVNIRSMNNNCNLSISNPGVTLLSTVGMLDIGAEIVIDRGVSTEAREAVPRATKKPEFVSVLMETNGRYNAQTYVLYSKFPLIHNAAIAMPI